MAENGFLAVIAILISGYSLLSEERRLDLKLRTSRLDYFIVGVLSSLILIVIYSPVIIRLNYFEPISWQWGFDEKSASFSFLFLI
ncbi:hypothetical protein CAG70_13990, partial [Photobacterium halotolerans]|nr:hypothetical protein [Photobacterium halotolerans]